MRTRYLMFGAIAVALVVAASVTAMTATDAIKERQKAMETNRDEMKVLGAIAKKEQPFEPGVVQSAADKIASDLARAAELFPEGSDQGDVQTWAKPEIWSDRGEFDRLLESTRQAAADLASVTTVEEFMPALGKLGNGCKSCHDLYRLPKN